MTTTIYADIAQATAHLPAWMAIDLGAIRRNMARVHAHAGVPLIAMVKADAYGLGLLPVARALGATFEPDHPATHALWALGVATLAEARQLRAAQCSSRILCFVPLLPDELAAAHALRVRPTLHRARDIVAWHAMGGGPWHLAIDTGMSRAGARWDDVIAASGTFADALQTHPPEGMFTHFHSADVATVAFHDQAQRFQTVCDALTPLFPTRVLVHTDNSAALARHIGSVGDLARPGLAVYGAGAVEALALENVVHVRARIVDMRTVRFGESVSYAATWTATAERRIATIAVGYGDGYRVALSNCGEVLVGGRRCPVVGRVTMDMTMIDVTEAPCDIGDVVTLLGDDGDARISIDEIAVRSGLLSYEFLVGLKLRLPRFYFGDA